MPFKRYVEIGRVCLINFGEDYGKLVIISDIVDQNRVSYIHGQASTLCFRSFRLNRRTPCNAVHGPKTKGTEVNFLLYCQISLLEQTACIIPPATETLIFTHFEGDTQAPNCPSVCMCSLIRVSHQGLLQDTPSSQPPATHPHTRNDVAFLPLCICCDCHRP